MKKKEKLKKLVVYREMICNREVLSQPSIEDHKDALTDDLALNVIEYLESDDHLQLQFVSNTIDQYTGDSIPFEIYSDGTYVWNSTLIHWVRMYKIQLPMVFLNHLKGRKSKSIKYSIDINQKMKSIFLEKSHRFFR